MIKYTDLAAQNYVKRGKELNQTFVRNHIIDGVYCWKYYLSRADEYRAEGDMKMHYLMRQVVRNTHNRMARALRRYNERYN